MALHLPRVEQVLGVGPLLGETDQALWAALGRAVQLAVPEAVDLDFKRDWYGTGDKATAECAKDCAAMANAAGGLVVCGVDDGGQDVAAALTPFPAPVDNPQEWVPKALAAKTAPKLPDVAVRVVPDSADPGRRAVLLVVPPSALAPHAVAYTRERLGYPMRRATITDWLSEAEVAERYRSRFALAGGQVQRAEDVGRLGGRGLDRTQAAWLTLALVPALPGSLRISRGLVQRAEMAASVWQQGALVLSQPRIGYQLVGRVRRRRVVLSSSPYQRLSDALHLELHVDGAGFAAQAVGRRRGGATNQWIAVDQRDVEVALLNLLEMLVGQAARVGATGDVAVLATLLPAWPDEALDAVVSTPDVQRMGVGRVVGLPLLVGPAGSDPDAATYEAARRTDSEPATLTVPLLALSSRPGELVAAAALLAADLLAEDGVSDLVLLTDDGRLDASALRRDAETEARQWSRERGLALRGEPDQDG